MKSPGEERNLLHRSLSCAHRKFRFGGRCYTHGVVDRTVLLAAHTVEDKKIGFTRDIGEFPAVLR